MLGDCSICMEMYLSGALIGMGTILKITWLILPGRQQVFYVYFGEVGMVISPVPADLRVELELNQKMLKI